MYLNFHLFQKQIYTFKKWESLLGDMINLNPCISWLIWILDVISITWLIFEGGMCKWFRDFLKALQKWYFEAKNGSSYWWKSVWYPNYSSICWHCCLWKQISSWHSPSTNGWLQGHDVSKFNLGISSQAMNWKISKLPVRH